MFSVIEAELALVEKGLQEVVASGGPEIRDIGSYIFNGKGKRIRPALFLLVARLRERDLSRLINGAVALELVHTASLLHDDVIDLADMRRGRPAANTRWGNRVAVLAGDYLLSRAFLLLLTYRDCALLDLLTGVVADMTEGEIEQAFAPGDISVMEERYFKWIEKKTAGFFAGCCLAGSLISGAGEPVQQLWAGFGYNLGIAFQLIDDFLDYTGDDSLTGKPLFNDLRNRVPTLPLIHALQSSRCEPVLDDFLKDKGGGTEQLQGAARAVLAGDGAAYTLQQAEKYARRAETALREISGLAPQNKKIFIKIIQQVLARNI